MQTIIWGLPVARLDHWIISLEETMDRMDAKRHSSDWKDLLALKWELQAARQYAKKKGNPQLIGNEEATQSPTADDLLAYVVSGGS